MLLKFQRFGLLITIVQVPAASLSSSSQVENNIYFYIKFDLDLTQLFKKNSFLRKTYFSHAVSLTKFCRRKVTWVFLVVITYSLITTFHLLKQVSYKLFQASGCLCFTSQTRVFHHSRDRLLKTIDVIVHVNSHESFWLLKNFLKLKYIFLPKFC